MKLIYNNIIPIKGYDAINIFGLIFARKDEFPISKYTINHEKIHTAQMKELLYLPFYIIYGAEYLIKLIKYRDTTKAYHSVSFEKEAYDHQNELEYLKNRPKYNEFRHEKD